jgi:hypothetical protein
MFALTEFRLEEIALCYRSSPLIKAPELLDWFRNKVKSKAVSETSPGGP